MATDCGRHKTLSPQSKRKRRTSSLATDCVAGERLASVAPRICDQQIGMRAKLRDHLQRSSFVWGRTRTTLRAKWRDLPTQVIEDPIWWGRIFDLQRKLHPESVGRRLQVTGELRGLGIKDERWEFKGVSGDDRLIVNEHIVEIETSSLEILVQDAVGDPVPKVEFTLSVLDPESRVLWNRTLRTDKAGRAILANIPRDEGFEAISVEEGWSIDSPTPNRFIHFRDFKDPLVIRIRDARLPTPAAPSAPALRRVSAKHALEVEFQRSHLRQIYRPIMENRAPVVEEAPKREPDGSWLLGILGAGTYSWSMLTPWGVKQVPFTVSTGAEVELAGPWHTSVTNDAPLRGRVTTRNGGSDNWFVVAGSADLTMAPMIQTAARAGVPPWMASVATDGSFSLEKHDQADPYVTLIAPGVAATRILKISLSESTLLPWQNDPALSRIEVRVEVFDGALPTDLGVMLISLRPGESWSTPWALRADELQVFRCDSTGRVEISGFLPGQYRMVVARSVQALEPGRSTHLIRYAPDTVRSMDLSPGLTRVGYRLAAKSLEGQ